MNMYFMEWDTLQVLILFRDHLISLRNNFIPSHYAMRWENFVHLDKPFEAIFYELFGLKSWSSDLKKKLPG